ncbi:MAG: hypothetical protein KJ893_09450 [Candidatus Omnitrophica bacterium]|nr:hypothetical protein [Candidatus Omnitrophota bacterium]MBU4478039.1 hypothetical protein [Candidatus Omnitrophota bacterium]MCG2704322.1 hypothetical protein [Candidatus Omnitrophota bacterium]
MSKARAGKEIHVVTENKIGTLSDISQWMADKGINIKAICAYVVDAKAHFLFVTSDNKKAMEILRAKDMKVDEDEVVVIELNDKIGMLKDIGKKLKNVDVDIKYLYGTTTGTPNAPSVVIFDSSDNKKAINAING